MNNKKPRVAVVYTHFPHYRSPIFNELSRSDRFDFSFFYDPTGVERTIKSGDFEGGHHSLRTYRLLGFYFQPGAIWLALFGGFDVYILLGNPYILSNWLAGIFARLRGRRVYFWTHGWLGDEGRLKRFIRNAFYRVATDLLLYGNRAKSIGKRQGFSESRMHVIYNSLDYASQSSAMERANSKKIDSETPYFLCVSRLVPGVDLELAIRALGMVKGPVRTNFEFVIVGSGPLRDSLEQEAVSLNAPVRFLGPIYDEDRLAELFRGCVAVVSPGKVGLLAMHALAYGAPVITHSDFDRQMPEVEAIESSVSGAFFPRGDAAALADVMSEFLCGKYAYMERSRPAAVIEERYTPGAQRRFIERALACIEEQEVPT